MAFSLLSLSSLLSIVLGPTDVNSWSRPPTTPSFPFISQRCHRPQSTPVSSSSPSACLSSTSAVHIPPHIPIRRLYSLDNRPSEHSPQPLRSPKGSLREAHSPDLISWINRLLRFVLSRPSGVGTFLQTCTITLTPTVVNGVDMVREEKSCVLTPDNGNGDVSGARTCS